MPTMLSFSAGCYEARCYMGQGARSETSAPWAVRPLRALLNAARGINGTRGASARSSRHLEKAATMPAPVWTRKLIFFFEFFVSKQNFCFETVIPGPSGTRENKKTSTFFRSRNRGEKGLRIFLVPEHRGWSAVLRLSQDSSRHRDSFVYQSCCKSTRFGAHLST